MLAADTILLFGAFRLVPAERALYGDQGPVRLHGRAFDLLLALLERPGEVVSKDDLIARVWPNTCVEEGNLRVHIGALRKVLQDGRGGAYVENVVGRGYTFVAPVRRASAGTASGTSSGAAAVSATPSMVALPVVAVAGESDDVRAAGAVNELGRSSGHSTVPLSPAVSLALPPASPSALPLLPASRLFGRDDALQRLAEQVTQRRLLTVAGPGGMGKTTVALAVAARLAPHFGQRVHVLDFAPLADGAQLGGALAMALGLPALAQDPVPGVLAHLQALHALLVFDNCEHVIDAAATLAERLLRDAPRVHIVATSREPLRTASESVVRLPPLALPPAVDGAPAAMDELLASPAVQLFAERASACQDGFRLDHVNALAVAEICRRLDGIPLAIELAAGRIDFFGVQGLAAELEDCFAVLTRGRRTALPRHQTLRATLDWSYDMLPTAEQAILRRFAIFRAPFSLECALDVVQCEQVARATVIDSIANLAAKSLLSVEPAAHGMQYRLLGTTRAYVLEKLQASGEQAWVVQRYAERCCTLMAQAQEAFAEMPLPEWLQRYARHIGHVQAALDWTLGRPGVSTSAGSGAPDKGSLALGLRLCAASATLWYQLSLLDEYRVRLELALHRLVQARQARINAAPDTDIKDAAADEDSGPAVEMRLQLALGHALVHAGAQPDGERRAQAFSRALALARQLDDGPAQLAALWGCYTDAIFSGDYRAALEHTEHYGAAAAAGNELCKVGHARMLARSLHYLGRQHSAREQVDFIVRHPLGGTRQALLRGFQFDQRISTQAIQGRVLWLLGHPRQSLEVAEQCVADALRLGHGVSLCFALLLGCTVATWSGEQHIAARYTAMLLEHSQRCALPHWRFWGEGFGVAQQLLHGAAPEDGRVLALHSSPYCGDMQTDVLATLHARLLSARALARAEAGLAGWSSAEVLRGWGVALWQGGSPEQAGQLLMRALAISQEQGARAWQLRAACSLAQLRQAQGRASEAQAALHGIVEQLARMDGGLATRDGRAAQALLASF